MSVTEAFVRLLNASEEKDIRDTILMLVAFAKDKMDEVVTLAVGMIKSQNFDGNKWSSLAFSLLNSFEWRDLRAGLILRSLAEFDSNNGAYLNNYGVFLQNSGQIGEAIEYFARAYATDYKYHGHERASTFPAWVNLHNIAMNIKASK